MTSDENVKPFIEKTLSDMERKHGYKLPADVRHSIIEEMMAVWKRDFENLK